MTTIEIGSVVILKGGGPKMTVTGIAVDTNGNDVIARRRHRRMYRVSGDG